MQHSNKPAKMCFPQVSYAQWEKMKKHQTNKGNEVKMEEQAKCYGERVIPNSLKTGEHK
jgi:hypothetical protein